MDVFEDFGAINFLEVEAFEVLFILADAFEVVDLGVEATKCEVNASSTC